MVVKFETLWRNHPYPKSPCDTALFTNQCAIRMGVALEKSGVDTSGFDRKYPQRRCYPGLNHSPKHILAAQELANWIDSSDNNLFGSKTVHTGDASEALKGKKGIVFIRNGWGPTDHIDLWDGETMKGGSPDYLTRGDEIWFWEISM